MLAPHWAHKHIIIIIIIFSLNAALGGHSLSVSQSVDRLDLSQPRPDPTRPDPVQAVPASRRTAVKTVVSTISSDLSFFISGFISKSVCSVWEVIIQMFVVTDSAGSITHPAVSLRLLYDLHVLRTPPSLFLAAPTSNSSQPVYLLRYAPNPLFHIQHALPRIYNEQPARYRRTKTNSHKCHQFFLSCWQIRNNQ